MNFSTSDLKLHMGVAINESAEFVNQGLLEALSRRLQIYESAMTSAVIGTLLKSSVSGSPLWDRLVSLLV